MIRFKYIIVVLCVLGTLLGCSKKEKIAKKPLDNSQEDLRKFSMRVDNNQNRILSILTEVKDNLYSLESEVRNMQEKVDTLKQEIEANSAQYDNLRREFDKVRAVQERGFDEYKILIERIEDRIEESQNRQQREQDRYYREKEDRGSVVIDSQSSREERSPESEDASRSVDNQEEAPPENLEGQVIKGKISGLNGGYRTY